MKWPIEHISVSPDFLIEDLRTGLHRHVQKKLPIASVVSVMWANIYTPNFCCLQMRLKTGKFSTAGKGNALKGKSQEKQDEASRLEEALQVLQENGQKIM